MKSALIPAAALAAVALSACTSHHPAGSPTTPAIATKPTHSWFASAEGAVRHECAAYGSVHVTTTAGRPAAEWTTKNQFGSGSGFGWFAYLEDGADGYRVTDCHGGRFPPHH
jgi:hypothetical protein